MALLRSIRGFTPKIGKECFLAETAVLIGEVTLGDRVSIWYNTVVRGDVHSIVIGDDSNIQDGAVIHATYQKAKTVIGKNVTVGHSAIIHGCTLEDFCLVGMGAKVLDLAVVQSDVIVAAGALVLEKSVLESGWLYAGVPAKPVKRLSSEQITGIRKYADHYIMYSQWFRETEGQYELTGPHPLLPE
jgi:carbonic anhydrase/acetyltransferase-like protein (isoleucine patch superfamily)